MWGQLWALPQLVRSRFSNICAQKIRSADYNEWPDFFLPWWHWNILKWEYHNSSGSSCERVVQGARGIIFTHRLAITECQRVQILTPLRIFGISWRRLNSVARLSHYQYKILAKKCIQIWKPKTVKRNVRVCDFLGGRAVYLREGRHLCGWYLQNFATHTKMIKIDNWRCR